MTRFMAAPPALILLALSGLPARAADAPPSFAVQTAGGKTVEGRLRELGPDWSVRIDDSRVDGADVLTVRRAGRLPPLPAGTQTQLVLAGGDCLPADKPLLIGERLHFRHPCLAGGEDTSVPLSAVSVIWFSGTAGEQPERLRRRLAAETRKRDVVLLRNGDRLEGVFTSVDEKAVVIEVDRKPVTVEVGRTAAVALSSDLTAAPRPKGVYGRVTLDPDGARLSLASARCIDGATLTGTTLFGASLSAPLANVAALDLYGGKAVYACDLKPIRYEFFPYLDDRWDYERDGSVTGLDPRLAGSTYDKCLGMHGHSLLTYAVPPGCHRFDALVGLDDRAGPRGSARVRLLADGKALALGGGELTAGGEPLRVNVDLAGAKELALEVDFAKDGPVRCRVDWVNARFVKEP